MKRKYPQGVYMGNYSKNYFNVGLIVYPPKLQMYRSVLMLTPEQTRELAIDTSDSAIRLYNYYISKRGWKHFNPLSYTEIGNDLGWTARKTETQKAKLVNAGYLLVIKDTLKDKTIIYRVLLGKDIVSHYNQTGEYPALAGSVHDPL